LLSSLFFELDSNPSIVKYVDIKISNNCSTDGTEKYLKSINRSNVYINNRVVNIGGNANIADGINNCQSNYLWILGDDDIPYNGLLTRIVQNLSTIKPDLLYLPAVWSLNVFEESITSVSNRVEFKKKDARQFLKIVGAKITFISSFIFSFDHFYSFKNETDIEIARETDFHHLAFYSPAILSGKSLYVVNKIVIRATGNTKFQYSLLQSFGIDLPNILRKIFKENNYYSEIIIKNIIIGFMPSFIFSILYGSKKSLDKEIPWIKLHNLLGSYMSFWIFIYPLRIIPKIVAIPLVMISRLFR